ncbi:AAA family ATPase [Pseudoponticoccus marisrubri]|uniref:Adenylyl-sulfate kinase n=1 Tax=Pseudoponticoccus marisrubri TaxID=1685382 RepID=A0A0W7WF50_9RHOB|nr:AAA family ATPase [Pseudoponticoccus marisrubri]KUF09095.1 hypothetical protein AVJ23_19420 [Pseudoponticoccus marisrubri]
MAGLVVLAGLPGVGKSTLARALAARIGALWLRIDAIEQALRESHMQVAGDLADGGYAAARAVAGAALGQGFDVVADSVNPAPVTRGPWRETARGAGADLCEVELICADKAIHRARVERRGAEVPGLALPDWAAVCRRAYHPHPDADLRLDSAVLGVDEMVARIVARLGP